MCSHHVNIIMLLIDYCIWMQLQLIIIKFQQPVGRACPMSYHDTGWYVIVLERFCSSFSYLWVFSDISIKKNYWVSHIQILFLLLFSLKQCCLTWAFSFFPGYFAVQSLCLLLFQTSLPLLSGSVSWHTSVS